MFESTVTIIIPVYNAEEYLQKCLESIINQTYNNLEIIIVNDGSTDTSAELIQGYSEKDKRIIYLTKENGGIGTAYKLALKHATGDYVLFVDSDDWLELNAVEELIKYAVQQNADMVHFGLIGIFENGINNKIPILKSIDKIISDNEQILRTHFEYLKHPSLARLVKKELLNDVVIFDQNIGIDEMLTPQLLVKCKKAVYTSKILYNIRIREDSVCRTKYNESKILQIIKVYRFLINFLASYAPNYKYHILTKYIKVLTGIYNTSILGNLKLNNYIFLKIREELRILKREDQNLPLPHTMNFSTKISYWWIVNYPFIYKLCLKIYNFLRIK